MSPLVLSSVGIVTALGRGAAATREALLARRDGLRVCDFPAEPGGLAPGRCYGHIGRVAAVEAHALPPGLVRFDCRNHRLAHLALTSDGFDDAVRAASARYGSERVAVVVGTSTSGILSTEEAYRRLDGDGRLPADFDYEHTHDLHALARFVRAALGLGGPAFTVSVACASSARAMIDAANLIEAGFADAAVVGGADSLCRLTIAGFSSLDVISPEPCRPCDAERSGISVGEAAAFCLLERRGSGVAEGVALLGAGASSDGYHMSSPRPDGAGAALAMRRALASAGLAAGEIDGINLHGTGTRANDAAEDAAVSDVFGREVPASSTKGFTGHTMGSCGAVEAVIAKLCIEDGFLPGCLRVVRVDPGFRSRVLTQNAALRPRRIVSNAFGFGGVNVSLVLGHA